MKLVFSVDKAYVKGHASERGDGLYADDLEIDGVPFELVYTGSRVNDETLTQLFDLSRLSRPELEELREVTDAAGPCDIGEIHSLWKERQTC